MDVIIYFKSLNIEKFGRVVQINRQYKVSIDKEERVSVPQSTEFKISLSPGDHWINVNLSRLLMYEPLLIQFIDDLQNSTSSGNVPIEIKTENNQEGILYFICKRNINYGDPFSQLILTCKNIFRNKKRFHKLVLKAVNESSYENEMRIDKEKNEIEEYLTFGTFTSLQRQIIIFEIIADLLLVPYGICLYNNYEGFAGLIGIPFVFVCTRALIQIAYYFKSKKMRKPNPMTIRIRTGLLVIVLVVVTYLTKGDLFVTLSSLFLLGIYTYIFYRTKSVFPKF